MPKGLLIAGIELLPVSESLPPGVLVGKAISVTNDQLFRPA